MFLSEWREFSSAPCLAGKKKTWWQLASRCCWNRARPWHASELVSFLVGLRTYQHPGRWEPRSSELLRRRFDDILSWTLKMEPIDCPETSVWNYHYSLRENPYEPSSNSPFWKILRTRPERHDVLDRYINFFFFGERKGPARQAASEIFLFFVFSECKNTPSFPPWRKTTCRKQDKRIRIL